MKMNTTTRIGFIADFVGFAQLTTCELFSGPMPLSASSPPSGTSLAVWNQMILWSPSADEPYNLQAVNAADEEAPLLSAPAVASGTARFARLGSSTFAKTSGSFQFYMYVSVSDTPGEADLIISTTHIVKGEQIKIVAAKIYSPG